MLKYILISNDLEITEYALKSGVDYIMIDLEKEGKVDRQKNFNMVQNFHSILDITSYINQFPNSKLIVRCNSPKYIDNKEIDQILELAPEYLMVPYFHSINEILSILDKVRDKKTKILPLIETITALGRLHDFAEHNLINDFYFGFNDLRLTIGYDFLFESLAYDLMDYAANILYTFGKTSFGFGGISRLGHGDLPADLILSEHVRLNSRFVILSRAFHNNSASLKELRNNIDFEDEIRKLRSKELELRNKDMTEINHNHLELREIVRRIVKAKK